MSKILQYLKTNTFRNNILIAIGFVLAIFLFIYLGLKVYTKHDESTEVPQV